MSTFIFFSVDKIHYSLSVPTALETDLTATISTSVPGHEWKRREESMYVCVSLCANMYLFVYVGWTKNTLDMANEDNKER